ncbi:MAG: hypothetical protein ACK5L5_11795 [Bacteroidales bacterium]
MIKDSFISKLADYALMNACSVDSSGLYNGKAGISLALFETARRLKNKHTEEQASNLLKEALLSKMDDIGFENGLAGIGYLLSYLITHRFIEADFEELFGDKHCKIETGIRALSKQDNTYILCKYLSIINYMHLLNEKMISADFSFFAEQILERVGELLLMLFNKTDGNEYSKIDVINLFNSYLKAVYKYKHLIINKDLLKLYIDLYYKNKFISNFSVGHYLTLVGKASSSEKIISVGIDNKMQALQNIYPGALSLAERINILFLLRQDGIQYAQTINKLEQLFTSPTCEHSLETNILKSIQASNFIAGYQSGIARFLIYCAAYKKPNKYEDILL